MTEYRTIHLKPEEWHRLERFGDSLRALTPYGVDPDEDGLEAALLHCSRAYRRTLAEIRARLRARGTPCPQRTLRPGTLAWTD